MSVINKTQLLKEIELANTRVRFLGVLPFNIDWDQFKESWYSKINEGVFSVEIICEAAHFVNTQSIIASDKRISGEDRSYELGSFINILAAPEAKLRKYLVDKSCNFLEPADDIPENDSDGYRQCFSLRTCYLHIPIPVINIDNNYYITLSLTKFFNLDCFERIEEGHVWYGEFQRYFNAYFENPNGATRYSTEITRKANRLEVIQSFDEKRSPTGILPRDSFLNTVQVKLVVWALIFTREGKLLIHKRKANAKDNQGMWDKSVGGHVAINDVDTVKAVARELAEELYKREAMEQGDHDKTDFMQVNTEKMIFLGEWLPDRRYVKPFEDVNSHRDEYYYFRLNYPFSTIVRNSPRHLPNGEVQDVSVFADVYVCITSEDFNTDSLMNSDYLILDLHELKDAVNTRTLVREVKGAVSEESFEVSPDLKSIIRSAMWDELASFSDYIKENYKKSRGN
jgi:hypothetical protein